MKQFTNYYALCTIVSFFLVGLFLPNFATAQFTVDNYTFDQGPIVKEDAFYGGVFGFAGTDSKGYFVARSSARRKLVVTAFDPVEITIDYFDKEMKPGGSFLLEDIYYLYSYKSDDNSLISIVMPDKSSLLSGEKSNKGILEFFLNPPKKKLSAIYSSYDKKDKRIGLHYKEILSSQGELSNETTIAEFVLADEKIIPRGKFRAIYSPDSSHVALFGYKKKEFGKEFFPAYLVVLNDKLEPVWQRTFDLWDDSLVPKLQSLNINPITAKLSNTGQLYLVGDAYIPSKNRKYVQNDKVQQRSFLFEVNSETIKPYPLDVNEELVGSLDMAWNQQDELIIVSLSVGRKTYNQLLVSKFNTQNKSFRDPLFLPLDEVWVKKYVEGSLIFRHILTNENGRYLLVGEAGVGVLDGMLEAENIILFDVSASGELRDLAYLEKEQRMTELQPVSYLLLPGSEPAFLYLNKKKMYRLGKYSSNGNASITDVFKYGDDEVLGKYALFNREFIEVNAKEKVFLAARLDAKNKADYRLVRITAKE